MKENEHEKAATQLQRIFENAVEKNKLLHKSACFGNFSLFFSSLYSLDFIFSRRFLFVDKFILEIVNLTFCCCVRVLNLKLMM